MMKLLLLFLSVIIYVRISFSLFQVFDQTISYSVVLINGCFRYLRKTMIYDKNEIFPVQGFRIGCFILDSLLTSSLECFYNSSCLHTFLKYININSTSIFFLSSNDYRSYFLACQVKSCSYTYQSRRSFLSILTTILGLIGGLTTILVFLIPILVQLKRRKKKQTKTISNRKIRIRRMFNHQNIIKQIRLINLFKSPDSHTENDICNYIQFIS